MPTGSLMRHWSFGSLLIKLITFGTKAQRRSRCITFQIAEAAISKEICFVSTKLGLKSISVNVFLKESVYIYVSLSDAIIEEKILN